MMYCGYHWWQKRKHQPRESTHLRPDKMSATILADHGIIERTVSRVSSRRPIMTHPQVKEYYDYHGAKPEAMTKRMCSGADINREAENADHAATSTTHAVPVSTSVRPSSVGAINQQVQKAGISNSFSSTNSDVRSTIGDTNLSHNLSDGRSTSRRTNKATTLDEAYSYLRASQEETHHEEQSSSSQPTKARARPHDSLSVDPNESDAEDDNETPPKRRTTVARSSRTVSEVADVKSKERGEDFVAIANAQQDTSGVEAPPTPVEEPNNAQGIGATAPTDHLYDLGGARDSPLRGNPDEDLQNDVPVNRVPVANMIPLVAPVYRNIGREEVLQNRILLLEQQMVDMQRFHLASTQLQQMQAFQTQAELLNTKQELINTKRELENTKGVLKHEQRKSRRLELASLPPLMPSQDPNTSNKRPRTQ
jgi:hypothetical protein